MVDSEKGPPDYTENQAITDEVDQRLQEFFKLSDDLVQRQKENDDEISKINQNLERIGSMVYQDLFPDKKDTNLPVTEKIAEIHSAKISKKYEKKATAKELQKVITERLRSHTTTTSSGNTSSTTKSSGKSTKSGTLSTEKAEEFEDIKHSCHCPRTVRAVLEQKKNRTILE